jgi:hypothetical protein
MIRPAGPPSRWIVDHGRPAEATGKDGMASYEHDDGNLLVLDLLVAQLSVSGLMLFPRDYGTDAVVAPDGLVPLHHSPAAWWAWRPCLRRLSLNDCCEPGWSIIGSQSELAWRYGLMQVTHMRHDEFAEFTMDDAHERAERLLLDNLTAHQHLEHAATGNFRVRGAKTGHTYRIAVGDGFERIDPESGKTITSYCLHTEEWMPADDQALATKLALEDEDLEPEVIKGARAYPRSAPRPPSLDEARAAKIEGEWRMVA